MTRPTKQTQIFRHCHIGSVPWIGAQEFDPSGVCKEAMEGGVQSDPTQSRLSLQPRPIKNFSMIACSSVVEVTQLGLGESKRLECSLR